MLGGMEITLYDFWEKKCGYPTTQPTSEGMMPNDYVEAGTCYRLSRTRGGTKKLDILTEVEIFYEDDK